MSRERCELSGADAMRAADAGVRDDQVHVSRAPRRAFETASRAQPRVRDVDGLERDTELRVRAADLARDLVEHGRAPRREAEVPSAARELHRERPPDPRRRSRDDCRWHARFLTHKHPFGYAWSAMQIALSKEQESLRRPAP
jgi:hypothetical protein